MPAGRPEIYSEELATALCALLAEGKSLRTCCKAEDMPGMSTVFKWLRTIPEFAQQYAKAKEESADALVEEMLDIADDGRNDWVETNDPENPGYRLNGEHYQRSRLRVDTRKWAASKLKAKKYGDKVGIEHSGGIELGAMTDEALEQKLASLLSKAQAKTGD